LKKSKGDLKKGSKEIWKKDQLKLALAVRAVFHKKKRLQRDFRLSKPSER